MQPRIVTWRAVSTEDQAERESLDYQDRLNKEHVAKWNGVIVEELEVPGRSRSIVLWEDACKTIPAYARLDELIRRKAFDILMCLDVTRLGRDRALIITTAALCERAGIRIYETSNPPLSIDGPHSTADSRLLLMLKGHISEEEVRKFSERSMFGRRARIKKGKHGGHPPYGYVRKFDDQGIAYFAIDEERAEVVRLFYDLYLNHGRSLQSICDEFNARGIMSPRSNNPWVPGNIRRFLLNCWLYAGYTSWGSYQAKTIAPNEYFRTKAEWEPIISEETARRTEAILAMRAKAPRSVSSPSRLSMVARCGYCGSTILLHMRAGTQTYATNRFLCRKRCRGTAIGEPDMMEAIESFIISLYDTTFLESLIAETPDQHHILKERLQEAKKALDAVREQRKRLTLAFTRDAISLEEYESIMADLKTRHDTLLRSVAETEDELAAIPSAEKNRSRLEEIRDRGIEYLYHEDVRTSNAWLRENFRLIIADYSVYAVQLP